MIIFIGDFAHGLVDHAADQADEREFLLDNDDARQVHHHIKKDD